MYLTILGQNMENELEKAFEDKFFCPARFAQEIESMVQTHEDMNYIDAIVSFCEINSIDLEIDSIQFQEQFKEHLQDLEYWENHPSLSAYERNRSLAGLLYKPCPYQTKLNKPELWQQ